MKKYIIILLLLIVPFLKINAEEVLYNNADIKFNIDESFWKKTDLSQERDIIDKKWLNDCGQITSGEIDIYDAEESYGLSREQYNYKNLFTNEEFANRFAKELADNYSADGWKYVDYSMRFIYIYGTAKQNGIEVHYDMYFTINNGYGVLIQYHKINSVDKEICKSTIEDVVSSAKPMGAVKRIEDDVDYSMTFIILLIGLVLTIICYEIYPFICIKIKKKKYTEKEFNKMILWNSIIVGGISFIIALSTNPNVSWSATPAFFYYFINKSVWRKSIVNSKKDKKDTKVKNEDKTTEEPIFDKEKQKSKKEQIIESKEKLTCDNCGAIVKEEDTKCPYCGALFIEENEEELEESTSKEEQQDEMFKCDNCGAIVNGTAKKCPKCGEVFEDEEDIDSDIDKKYKDLNKLKELLDNKIITKKEFEKEKKKVLKK